MTLVNKMETKCLCSEQSLVALTLQMELGIHVCIPLAARVHTAMPGMRSAPGKVTAWLTWLDARDLQTDI